MLFLNRVASYNTLANDGLYLVISSVCCECCGDPITSSVPVVVRDGKVQKKSVERAVRDLLELHPRHCILAGVTWEGDGSFLFRFA